MSSGPTSLTWGVMVFNATFNNISVISCRSVLLVEETGYREITIDPPLVTDKFYLIMLYRLHLVNERGSNSQRLW